MATNKDELSIDSRGKNTCYGARRTEIPRREERKAKRQPYGNWPSDSK